MGKKLIITEEERNEILNLHNSMIFEGPEDALGNQGTPVVGATPSGPTIAGTMNQPSVPTQQPTQQPTKITQLQNKLNEKFKSGLKADGKWGPKTATAVLTALKGLSSSTPQQPTPQQPQKPAEEPMEKLPLKPIEPLTRTNTQLTPLQTTNKK